MCTVSSSEFSSRLENLYNSELQLTIEKVFCAYGISEQVADVFDHGCWCGAPFGSDVFHGKPVDEADYRAFLG